MSFIQLLKNRFTREQRNFIVVTLEETFDAKNLVGTYVCNETGEFTFKKGPLTVAAEQGLWLVLRNIERSPPDLLSFLLPLVQENKLQVTSAFEITPALGFRIFALSHEEQGLHSDDVSGVRPFLSHLHRVSLEPLRRRQDFAQILETLFPAVHRVVWMTDLLFRCVLHIEEKLNKMRGQMLDCVHYTIKHVLKLFARVDRSLESHLQDAADVEQLFLSSSATQGLLQDISEVYLAHLYSQTIFTNVIGSLVTQVINPCLQTQNQAPIDAQELIDYTMVHGRQYGISPTLFYFGRAAALERLG